MSDVLAITRVEVTPAPTGLRSTGLLAFLLVEFAGTLVVDGIQARRTRAGRVVLAWPERRGGRRVVSPAGREAREGLDARILELLRQRGDLS